MNKVILLALLGLSALNCADAGPQARVEAFLAKPTYQADFQALDPVQKKQLAADLKDCYDNLVGVAVKKANLQRLCEPYLDKGGAKTPVEVSHGKMKNAYEKAAAAAGANLVKDDVVLPKKLNMMAPEEEVQAPMIAPKAPIVVPGSVAEKLAFFKNQSEQMQAQVAAQKGKKDAAQDKRLHELQLELGALRAPLAEALAAFEQAAQKKQLTEILSKKATEDAESAELIKMSINLDDAALSAAAKEKINGEVAALFAAGKEAATRKKQELDAANKITDANAMQVILNLARANNFTDALFLSRFLAEDYLAKAAAARVEAEDANRQAIEQEANTERMLKALEASFQALSEEIQNLSK